MIINSYLYKNEILHQKILNINALCDKNIHVLIFNENDTKVEITFEDNNFSYKRMNTEYDFLLEKNKNKAILIVKELGKEILLELLEYRQTYNKNQIIIEYRLETEAEILNKIIIEIEGEEL